MADLPTLVFIPGSWHQPTCYNKVTKILREQYQMRCTAVTLPSTNGDPESTFKDDLDAAQTAISDETSQSRDVVVIAHSYGGMVGNSAIKGFASRIQSNSNDSSTLSGQVIGLVLIASGFTLTGLSFMDPLFGIPPPTWRVNRETGFAELVTPPRQLFYHDVPADEADYWVSQLTPQSLKALFEGGEYAYAGWQDVPVWYIGTTKDKGLPVALQRVNVGMARELGADVVHRELQSSHSPFLSQPDETVDLLWEAVVALTGKTDDRAQASFRTKEAEVPAVLLWQPYSWFKYGLPLTLGHAIGRGLLIFRGAQRLWRAVSSSKAKSS